MLKMKKLFTLIVFSCLFVLVVAGCGSKKDDVKETNTKQSRAIEQIKKRGKLVVGVKNDTNLFGLKNPSTGQVEGFDVDVAKALAKKILGDEKKLELKEVTSKTRIPMLKNGDIDAIIATMTITEERKKEVDFSDVYFKAGQSLLVKKGSNIKSIDDIKQGVKVLAVKGSTSTNNIRQKSPEATVLEFENYSEAFTALKAGKGDVLTTDNAILYGMAKQDANYEVVGKIFTDEPYGIAVQKGADDLTKEINNLLKDMKTSGEYDKLYEKWIGQKQEK
ncbi:glutamine ABC transporter substrate-binding protein [Bacillus toyonensis]|uniref:Glutamine ABC transporter substrate-binding protein n=1 Tax=Bacillus toyonensis TaxID=155322 RepID=A0AB36TA91_9BACI|nr:glutamine ABC transporter substrate-binding protein GlnH [Bacillus toyonensis]EEL60849.1 ATP synthase subunit beta [Bacillus cereus Rock4-18]PEC11863.1 glutamine ABC transporter substrate-binding protein [Bacillus toyonensis]PED94173.1 glutamine ABC transporter substrate-binding protein [Bacillus toyonensis]PEK41818.1 glutamine ABC transporter substrate-binding protein [Bacillus toyonensis]PEL57382.1 glutamine ABC transporter substrate-binding protein [Bacillus toyonensis]